MFCIRITGTDVIELQIGCYSPLNALNSVWLNKTKFSLIPGIPHSNIQVFISRQKLAILKLYLLNDFSTSSWYHFQVRMVNVANTELNINHDPLHPLHHYQAPIQPNFSSSQHLFFAQCITKCIRISKTTSRINVFCLVLTAFEILPLYFYRSICGFYPFNSNRRYLSLVLTLVLFF